MRIKLTDLIFESTTTFTLKTSMKKTFAVAGGRNKYEHRVEAALRNTCTNGIREQIERVLTNFRRGHGTTKATD